MDPSKLTEIWKTCNKIRAAIARKFIDLSSYFHLLDLNKTGLVSGKFLNCYSINWKLFD